jgi:hypothetical protein
MMWSVKSRTTREPLDRRQRRLVQALLAFPAAGIIGFSGSAIVKGVRTEAAPVASPAKPKPVTDDKPSSHEHDDDQDSPRDYRRAVRNA